MRLQTRPAGALALRPARARRLRGARARCAVFTLHVGALVLSDQAVIASRDKSLVMMWKFFDQSVAMTRVRGGRVVLFDFSTEYDVPFNDNFIKYMKQREMPIVICEIDKPDEPFATCSLPLRDALLHTNKRADISLALIAGPAMAAQYGAVPVPAVPRDELGVLDLWCMLRCDDAPRRPVIRHSSGLPSRELDMNYSRLMVQEAEDEHSNALQELALNDARGGAARRSRNESRMWSQHALNYQPQASPARTADRGTSTSRILEEKDADYDTLREYHRQSSQTPNLFPASSSDLGYDRENRWFGHMQYTPSGIIQNEVPVNIRSTDEMKQALEKNLQSGQMLKLDDSRLNPDSLQDLLKKERKLSGAPRSFSQQDGEYLSTISFKEEDDAALTKKYSNINKIIGLHKLVEASKKTVKYNDEVDEPPCGYAEEPVKLESPDSNQDESIDITVLWLALNEECDAMLRPSVQRLYVAYSFLGRRGADLETPVSLPKPKHYADKCYFNFKKTFHLHEADLPLLGHMSRCRAPRASADPRDCIVFSVVSEPPEDPLGLSSCEDIGYAYLYLGDILVYSAGGSGYTDVMPVRARRAAAACGALAVRVDGLAALRRAGTCTRPTIEDCPSRIPSSPTTIPP